MTAGQLHLAAEEGHDHQIQALPTDFDVNILYKVGHVAHDRYSHCHKFVERSYWHQKLNV